MDLLCKNGFKIKGRNFVVKLTLRKAIRKIRAHRVYICPDTNATIVPRCHPAQSRPTIKHRPPRRMRGPFPMRTQCGMGTSHTALNTSHVCANFTLNFIRGFGKTQRYEPRLAPSTLLRDKTLELERP